MIFDELVQRYGNPLTSGQQWQWVPWSMFGIVDTMLSRGNGDLWLLLQAQMLAEQLGLQSTPPAAAAEVAGLATVPDEMFVEETPTDSLQPQGGDVTL